MKCRHCQTELHDTFIDLGFSPPSNAYLKAEDLQRPETHYPLKVMVCRQCWLVQTEDYTHYDQLFATDYAYFSSTSSTWLKHASDYVDMIAARLNLGAKSLVVELAANDGYLLQYVQQKGIPCLGVEPTRSTADAAREKGIPIVEEFFGVALGQRLRRSHGAADLIAANNVLAHVPDINDFVGGMAALLAPQGTVTVECPHLLNLIGQSQFDTIYHEHFSYLSLVAVERVMRAQGLRVYDVEELPTHGGSLRIYACHLDAALATTPAVTAMLARERAFGLESIEAYDGFQRKAEEIKAGLLEFLLAQKRAGKKVLAYGAAAKGNTLLNYSGVHPDLLPLVADAAPSKQGKYMPGSHIPIVSPARLLQDKPDVVLILPWNIKDEVARQLAEIRGWGGHFAIAVPQLQVW
ncbi:MULTISPECIES: class I SAM-dependent methyltransferase [unclassified Herbaspirillum]|uniref:class I SAM-dependent methyltransferase n=1 Tax=unclassified Herbaspirillum TaxID=2624150 RepID=UPI001153556D|nr:MULTISPECIES: class I SAM-dependent methyltransferase [unclassified Herbaspirillum]MBB5390101.1 SAM-dependent methyltransferase [Herbaspirillum sp. SJZ102]TQK09400.1 methyltransferase family protein [Herbaspirillum sp. SJZ130]TQK13913.1 methyltransferase family protein [Herbaspirillum sp. SJZ106]TWC69637.1 methyltransferase family protein [Herbaspirillum sp. SJZ099]